ncbi:hypothetical protein GOV06_01270 [Candidatus Woesearchaeota archaeon]|nr:hypothetical protein [Candidatus Woesearchaeota archaeon]
MAKEEFEHLKKYKKRSDMRDVLVDTTNVAHTKAHVYAIDEVLRDEKGKVRYERMKKTETQLKLADKMADSYIKDAKKSLKSELSKEDEFESELLMKAYAGVTRAELRRIAADAKEKFTLEEFEKTYKPKFMETIKETLKGAVASHLREEHIEDIIKYTGIDKHGVDYARVRLPEAIRYLDTYHEIGTVPPKSIPEEHKKKGKVIKGEFGKKKDDDEEDESLSEAA